MGRSTTSTSSTPRATSTSTTRSSTIPVGLRGRAAGRRRQPGRRGPDGRQLLHRHRAGSRGPAGAQQDRPAGTPSPSASSTRSRRSSASTRHGRGAHQRQDRRRASSDVLEQICGAHPATQGRPRRAAAGADHRLLVRRLRRRRDVYLRVVEGRISRKRSKILIMSTGREFQADDVGVFTPKDRPRDALSRRGGLRRRRHQGDRRRRGSATRSPSPSRRGQTSLCRASRRCSRAVFAGLYPIDSDDYETCARRCEAPAQRRGAALRARDLARRSASASAAASSACCTWRSSRSGSSASTTWT